MTVETNTEIAGRLKALDRLGKRVQGFKDKIAANVTESKRQAQFAGERFGVFARLKELERERRRWATKLIELDPANEVEYAQYLW